MSREQLVPPGSDSRMSPSEVHQSLASGRERPAAGHQDGLTYPPPSPCPLRATSLQARFSLLMSPMQFSRCRPGQGLRGLAAAALPRLTADHAVPKWPLEYRGSLPSAGFWAQLAARPSLDGAPTVRWPDLSEVITACNDFQRLGSWSRPWAVMDRFGGRLTRPVPKLVARPGP